MKSNKISERIYLTDFLLGICYGIFFIFASFTLIPLIYFFNSFYWAYLVMIGEPVGEYSIIEIFQDKKLRYKLTQKTGESNVRNK